MRGLCAYADPANGNVCSFSRPTVRRKRALLYTHTHWGLFEHFNAQRKEWDTSCSCVSPCFRGGVTALMVQFIVISEYAGGGVCKSNMLRVMSSGKMTEPAIQSLCQLFPWFCTGYKFAINLCKANWDHHLDFISTVNVYLQELMKYTSCLVRPLRRSVDIIKLPWWMAAIYATKYCVCTAEISQPETSLLQLWPAQPSSTCVCLWQTGRTDRQMAIIFQKCLKVTSNSSVMLKKISLGVEPATYLSTMALFPQIQCRNTRTKALLFSSFKTAVGLEKHHEKKFWKMK